jgi:mRNA interferase RelE/StbE
MAWFRLAFRETVAHDLQAIDKPTAQRLFEKTKWLASNVGNLRHESIDAELPGLHKYAVGDWRIFYSVDQADQILDVHAIVHKHGLRA